MAKTNLYPRRSSNSRRALMPGWQPDTPDIRDYTMQVVRRRASLPVHIDLTKICPPVYDQGQLGSCVGNSVAGLFEFNEIQLCKDDFTPSRLFIYYNARAIEGTTKLDAGAQIRDGIKAVVKKGACPEEVWPYVESKFAMKPPRSAYANGLTHQAIAYSRVPRSKNAIMACLAGSYPIVFGFTCYDAFESDEVAKTGILTYPKPDEGMVGGHAVLCVGYDAQNILVRNSWGKNWGLGGYFFMPWEYILNPNLADDFWTIRSIEG